MNDIINELVDEIKKDPRYIDYLKASKLLEKDDVKDLLKTYQNALNEYQDLKRFDGYIDLTDKKEEIKRIKKEISENKDIQQYYASYYKINELLDHVTHLVFDNISDSLDMTGFKK